MSEQTKHNKNMKYTIVRIEDKSLYSAWDNRAGKNIPFTASSAARKAKEINAAHATPIVEVKEEA